MKIDNEPMTTNVEFEQYCRRLGIPLTGIYNKDILPSVSKQGYYLINLQDDLDEHGNDLDGTHWTCFIIEGKKACYLDSFGFPPPVQVKHFLKPFVPYPYNIKQIQNPRSHVCGYFCLYFFWFMMHHPKLPMYQRFDRFIDLWDDDDTKNLTLLKKYIHSL